VQFVKRSSSAPRGRDLVTVWQVLPASSHLPEPLISSLRSVSLRGNTLRLRIRPGLLHVGEVGNGGRLAGPPRPALFYATQLVACLCRLLCCVRMHTASRCPFSQHVSIRVATPKTASRLAGPDRQPGVPNVIQHNGLFDW